MLYSFSILGSSKPNCVIKILDIKKKRKEAKTMEFLLKTNDVSGRYYLGIITITIIIEY